MRTRTWSVAGLAFIACLAFVLTGCPPGENGTERNGGGGKPQLDVGTFGVIEKFPDHPNYDLHFQTAWAWVPLNAPGHELWILYKMDHKAPPPGNEPLGFMKPGEDYEKTELHLDYKGRFDPPGTNSGDGIDANDRQKFKEWVKQQYDAMNKPCDLEADLTLFHHIATVH